MGGSRGLGRRLPFSQVTSHLQVARSKDATVGWHVLIARLD